MKMGYYFMTKQFGKPSTTMTVFSARMPTAFTMFYGKIAKLDKKRRPVCGDTRATGRVFPGRLQGSRRSNSLGGKDPHREIRLDRDPAFVVPGIMKLEIG